jgi:hypothetical protein
MKNFFDWKLGAIEILKRRNEQILDDGSKLAFHPIQTPQNYNKLYENYRIATKQQSLLVDKMMDFSIIKRALFNFENLEKITMNICDKMYSTNVYEHIGPWDYALESPNTRLFPLGVRQLNSLLLGIANSRQIKKASSRLRGVEVVHL